MLETESGVEQEVIESTEETEAEQVAEQVEEIEEITVADSESHAEESEEEDTPVIRKVREAHREEQRKRKELENRLKEVEAQLKPKEEPAPEVGAKPTLADYEFDGDAYAAALETYFAKQQARAAWDAKQRAKEDEVKQRQQTVLENYEKATKALPVDYAQFKEAEKVVVSSLSPATQTAILDGFEPDDQAKLVYVLGKFPSKLEMVQGIESPVKLGKVLGDILRGVSVTKRPKDVPPPEKVITKGSPSSGSIDRLLEKARESGDYTEYMAAKRAATKK